jgi:hypothetical protein
LSGSTITWHTAILKKYAIVQAEKDGAKKKHYLNKEALPILEKLRMQRPITAFVCMYAFKAAT